MKGYGFGVWLIPEENQELKFIKHQPHITIMCMMEREDAFKLKDKLSVVMGEEFTAEISRESCVLGGSYHKEERLKSSGYKCYVNGWYIAQRVCQVFGGAFSYDAHLSSHYSEEGLEMRDLGSDIKVKCRMEVVDIRDDHPKNWCIL